MSIIFQVMVLPEPVDEWQNVNGTNLLDLMFNNGTRYFGTFQLESTFTRYVNIQIFLSTQGRMKIKIFFHGIFIFID